MAECNLFSQAKAVNVDFSFVNPDSPGKFIQRICLNVVPKFLQDVIKKLP